MSWPIRSGYSSFGRFSSCPFLKPFFAFRFRWTSEFSSGLSDGTSHPFLVPCPDSAIITFWIWGSTWLLIASLMALCIWTLTEFIISSISREIREFNSLDNLFISALELPVTEFRSHSVFIPGSIFLWDLFVFSFSFSDSLLTELLYLPGKLLFKLPSLSLVLKWLSPNIISKFSISDNISCPLDFLAFFCFLVVGIETNPGWIFQLSKPENGISL